jgi:hypothetical protein
VTPNTDPPRQDEPPRLGIIFKCCNVYAHVRLNAQKTAFVGWCPKCAARLEVPVDPHGSDARFFEAG